MPVVCCCSATGWYVCRVGGSDGTIHRWNSARASAPQSTGRVFLTLFFARLIGAATEQRRDGVVRFWKKASSPCEFCEERWSSGASVQFRLVQRMAAAAYGRQYRMPAPDHSVPNSGCSLKCARCDLKRHLSDCSFREMRCPNPGRRDHAVRRSESAQRYQVSARQDEVPQCSCQRGLGMHGRTQKARFGRACAAMQAPPSRCATTVSAVCSRWSHGCHQAAEGRRGSSAGFEKEEEEENPWEQQEEDGHCQHEQGESDEDCTQKLKGVQRTDASQAARGGGSEAEKGDLKA